MEKSQISIALKELREKSPKRNFNQSVDILITLKDIDMKKQENKIEIYTILPHTRGKKIKICGLVDQSLASLAKKSLDNVVLLEDFKKYDKKKDIKKLATEYDFFVAQDNIMTKIATTFGKVLGPKKKMPNPKAGCIIPGNIPSLEPIVERLNKTVKLISGNEKAIKTCIGRQDMQNEELIDNILAVYSALITKLPNEASNIKNVMLKFTMGPGYIIDKGIKEK